MELSLVDELLSSAGSPTAAKGKRDSPWYSIVLTGH
jgi:hypothetical protein